MLQKISNPQVDFMLLMKMASMLQIDSFICSKEEFLKNNRWVIAANQNKDLKLVVIKERFGQEALNLKNSFYSSMGSVENK